MVETIDFVLETAQVEALRRLLQKLEHEISPAEPMGMYIAGGMAVHLYTGYRTTVDVDVEFSQRVLIPPSLFVDKRTPCRFCHFSRSSASFAVRKSASGFGLLG